MGHAYTPCNDSSLVVAANIRHLTRERGMTQADLARALDLPTPTITKRWWGDWYTWQVWEVAEVAHVLHVPVAALFERHPGRPLHVPREDRPRGNGRGRVQRHVAERDTPPLFQTPTGRVA